jgi:hypothetical protein
MSILETGHEMPNSVPTVDSLVIDGASLVYSKQPGQSRTFDDYANDIILPHIKSLAQSHLRVDVVFDVYSWKKGYSHLLNFPTLTLKIQIFA